MRLVFVIPYFYPAWQYGGQPRSCYELARILARRGHAVKVLTTDSGGSSRIRSLKRESDGSVRLDGMDVFYYKNISNYLAYRHRLFWPLGFFRGIREKLESCDVLHIHELRSTLTVIAYLAARRRRLPYVLSTHGGLRRLGKESAKQVYDRLFGDGILKHAAILAAVSPHEVKEAQAFDVQPSRVRLLPNTVLADDYANLPARGAFRSRHGLTAGPLILFLGRLHWVKGADLLIEAFVKMNQDASGLQLVIAGPDDGQEAELRRLVANAGIQSRVIFTGYLDQRAKQEALVDSDVLVIPSRSEVFAITALEALICGIPVLVSSACGFAPMPAPRCGMRQFETENTSDLAGQLKNLLRPGEARPDVEASRKFVANEFSTAAVAEHAESLYRDAIASEGWVHS